LLAPPVALAELTSSVDENGVLTVTSDADDEIRIWCSEGKVLINGYAPGSGEANCSTITKIVVRGGPGDNTMDLSDITRAAFPGLSDGNVEMWGGDGNDTMTGSEFGDYQNGEAGDDTLDASGVTSPITIDLDLQDVDQVVDAAGNTLRLEGQFETFIGGPFPDVVSASPLTVPRRIDGGGAPPTATHSLGSGDAQQGDILNFNAHGLPLTDTGTSLIVAGFAPVTYTNFVTVTISNAGVDLSLGKSAEPEAVIPGERLTYTLTITNAGPVTPISATVVDTFSDANALADVTSDGDCAWSPGSATVTCTVTNIVSGTPAHLTLGVTTSISASGVLSNTAVVTPTGGVMDVDASNNVARPVQVTFKQAIYLPLVLRSSSQPFR
jgi:uncharacterized repeat protein (TIGR01451 family)